MGLEDPSEPLSPGLMGLEDPSEPLSPGLTGLKDSYEPSSPGLTGLKDPSDPLSPGLMVWRVIYGIKIIISGQNMLMNPFVTGDGSRT